MRAQALPKAQIEAALNPNGLVWLKAQTRLDALAPVLDWLAAGGRSFGRIAADTVTGQGPFPLALHGHRSTA